MVLLPKFEVLSVYRIKSQACSNHLHSQRSDSKLGAGARSAGMRSSKQPGSNLWLRSVREGPHSDLHMHTMEHTCTHIHTSHTQYIYIHYMCIYYIYYNICIYICMETLKNI